MKTTTERRQENLIFYTSSLMKFFLSIFYYSVWLVLGVGLFINWIDPVNAIPLKEYFSGKEWVNFIILIAVFTVLHLFSLVIAYRMEPKNFKKASKIMKKNKEKSKKKMNMSDYTKTQQQ